MSPTYPPEFDYEHPLIQVCYDCRKVCDESPCRAFRVLESVLSYVQRAEDFHNNINSVAFVQGPTILREIRNRLSINGIAVGELKESKTELLVSKE